MTLTNGTSKADLSAVIKSIRNVMRKDAGLSGELDRMPQLAWLLFLKAYDDLELNHEVQEPSYTPALTSPYRWRDWAANPIDGRTGDHLIQFVNGDLLPYLRGLKGKGVGDPRDVIASVFQETQNRMLSGYLLRDVLNLISRIDFASSDEIHTMAHLYESMLREMRDAAGDSGEFYTPRPLIRLIVEQVGLRLGDRVLDPAVGTAGFLVEAHGYLFPRVQTADDLRRLNSNLLGIEKKPMPFLLAIMNLLLHGVEDPKVRRENALAVPLLQIPASAKVDVIVTNPPFGGAEETGIPENFPDATRTAETALLYLQLVQRLLKPEGRCGIVVPNGVLFGDGVAARIKERLVKECNLHTVLRFPAGVFAPYTSIPTNVLFFSKTGATREVWFYEHRVPDQRKNYTKTRPLTFEELTPIKEWWGHRTEGPASWRVPIAAIRESGYNLDLHNPRGADSAEDEDAKTLLATLLDNERKLADVLAELKGLV